MRGLDAARAALASPWLPGAAAALAAALTAPSLGQGWVADDLIHRAILLTEGLPEVLEGLFVFMDPARNRRLMELGAAPWWTFDALRVSFFRPLPALTHWLDRVLWRDSGVLMHAQSVLWYSGACYAAALVYRRLMGPSWIAGLAACLFAVDVVHLGAVGWLANRNGLMGFFFGLLTLLAHDRWRQSGERAKAFLAVLWLGAALLSAEGAVAVGAYLLGYALWIDRGTWRSRVGSLLPYGALVVVWQSIYQHLGYGTWGSGFYTDPVRQPGAFAAAVLDRGPILLASQWLAQIPLLYNLLSIPARRAGWLVAVLVLIGIGLLCAALIRGDRAARVWALGMVLAVVPACSISLLSGRLLLFSGLGAMGLMSQFIAGLIDRCGWVPVRPAWRAPAWILCGLLIALHVVLAPILLPVLARTPDATQDIIARVTDLGPLPDAARRDVVIVNAPSPFHFIYVPSLRILDGQALPSHIRILAPGYASVDLTREDEQTVRVRPAQGYLLTPGTRVGGSGAFDLLHVYQEMDAFFRGRAFPMLLGQQVTLAGMRAQVTAMTPDGRPAEARMHFSRALEDPALTWLRWDWGKRAYVSFVPPAIGETARLPGPG